MITGVVVLSRKSDENCQVRIFEPNENTFHNFYLLSSHTRSEVPSKNIHAKGNEKQGERGLHSAAQYGYFLKLIHSL